MKNVTIYCDFDGTITTTDNIIALMKKFTPPQWVEIKDAILSQQISIKSGVGKMFSLLDSSLKEEMIDYLVQTAKIRPGFVEFVQFTKQENIDLKIVSGGIDFFVHPLLDGLIPKENIYCNGADFSGEKIEILWPHPCDSQCDNDCGCCKTSIIRQIGNKEEYSIVIGDSITDLQPAKLADLVFACDDFLIEKCKELQLNYEPFVTFYDVMSLLKAEVNQP